MKKTKSYSLRMKRSETVFRWSHEFSAWMKKYNYFYDRQPITMCQFLKHVPEDWENDVQNGYYSYGYYHANELEPDPEPAREFKPLEGVTLKPLATRF